MQSKRKTIDFGKNSYVTAECANGQRVTGVALRLKLGQKRLTRPVDAYVSGTKESVFGFQYFFNFGFERRNINSGYNPHHI